MHIRAFVRSLLTLANRLRLLVLLSLYVLLASCSFYNHEWTKTSVSEHTADYDLHVVQADDFGTFWDPSHVRDVVNEIEDQSNQGNVLMVVFIHGWHDNAAPDNDSLLKFKGTLQKIGAQMRTTERMALRQKYTSQPNLRIVGVYVGWRGRSLPKVLDYSTYWWRKEAAERVGDGDVSEFILRLQRIYLRGNSTVPPANGSARQTRVGLVTIGHSFGGQVLLKALARPLESDLVERTRGKMSDTTKPPIGDPAPTPEYEPIDSYGDLNILINPALEAYQFARIDGLYRKISYCSAQTPQLLVLSARNDTARSFWFPMARYLSTPLRPFFRDSHQAALFNSALGDLPEEQSHTLDLSADPDSLVDADLGNDDTLVHADFSGAMSFDSVKLQPQWKPPVANSPVAVAVVESTDIIDGHSGFFTPKLEGFLVKYVSFLEAKRLVVRHERLEAAMSHHPKTGCAAGT